METWPHTLFSLFPSNATVGVLPRPESSGKLLGSIGTHESVQLLVSLGFQFQVLASHLGRTLAHELGWGGGCYTLHGFPLLPRKCLGVKKDGERWDLDGNGEVKDV